MPKKVSIIYPSVGYLDKIFKRISNIAFSSTTYKYDNKHTYQQTADKLQLL